MRDDENPMIDTMRMKELNEVTYPYGADPDKVRSVIMSAMHGVIPLEIRIERFFNFLSEIGNKNTAMRKAGLTQEEWLVLRVEYPNIEHLIEQKIAEFESQMLEKVKDIALGETKQNFNAATYLLEKTNPSEFASKGGVSNNININLGDNILAETMERLNSGYIHTQKS